MKRMLTQRNIAEFAAHASATIPFLELEVAVGDEELLAAQHGVDQAAAEHVAAARGVDDVDGPRGPLDETLVDQGDPAALAQRHDRQARAAAESFSDGTNADVSLAATWESLHPSIVTAGPETSELLSLDRLRPAAIGGQPGPQFKRKAHPVVPIK